MPVAVNLYRIREAKDAGGELFRSVRRQKSQYQGIWIVSPEGKVLGAHQDITDRKNWTGEVQSVIAAALEAFGPVTPRPAAAEAAAANPLPYRGLSVQPDGGISLALYVRGMRGGGRQSAPASINSASLWLWDGELKPNGPPVLDTLRLTQEEWRSFLPSKTTAVGTEWTIPETVARKLARVLSPSSDQSTMPRPEEATVAKLRAQVEGVERGQVRVRLWGRWETKHVYNGKTSYAWAAADGVAISDAGQKSDRGNGASAAAPSPLRLRSLLLTFSGAYRMAPPYDGTDTPTGAVAEWRRDAGASAASLIPPRRSE